MFSLLTPERGSTGCVQEERLTLFCVGSGAVPVGSLKSGAQSCCTLLLPQEEVCIQ